MIIYSNAILAVFQSMYRLNLFWCTAQSHSRLLASHLLTITVQTLLATVTSENSIKVSYTGFLLPAWSCPVVLSARAMLSSLKRMLASRWFASTSYLIFVRNSRKTVVNWAFYVAASNIWKGLQSTGTLALTIC